MPSAFLWLGIACVAVSALASQQGEGGTACVHEDDCEGPAQEDEVVLLQLQLNSELASVSTETVKMEIEKRSEETEGVAQLPAGDGSSTTQSPTPAPTTTTATTSSLQGAILFERASQTHITDDWYDGGRSNAAWAIDGDPDTVFTAKVDTALVLYLPSRHIGMLEITFGLCACDFPDSIRVCHSREGFKSQCGYLGGLRNVEGNKVVKWHTIDQNASWIWLQVGPGYNTSISDNRWQIWEVKATNWTSTTTTTTGTILFARGRACFYYVGIICGLQSHSAELNPLWAIDGDPRSRFTAMMANIVLELYLPDLATAEFHVPSFHIGMLQITFGYCLCEAPDSMQVCYTTLLREHHCEYLGGFRNLGYEVGDVGYGPQYVDKKVVKWHTIDQTVSKVWLQTGPGYDTVSPVLQQAFGWQIWEVNATTWTTTTTPRVNWQPTGTPVRIDCQYPPLGSRSLRTLVEVACGDAYQLTSILATTLIGGPEGWRLPAKISSDIVQMMQLRSEKYFVNASLEGHRALSTQGFGLLAYGLASMVGGNALKDFMTNNSLSSAGALKDQIATWIDSNNSVKLCEAVSAGALDTVASVSGPFGAAATFVSSILSYWGTEDNKANLELIAKEIKEEVAGFVASQTYEEELARTQGYIKVFTQRLGYVLEAFQAISLRVPANGGMQQFILLSDLESELAVTRSEWLLFSREGQPGCNDCNSDCDPQKAMPHIVPVLITMHLALLQQMSFCVVSDNVLAYQVQKKFYQHAFEYYLYMRRIGMGKLWTWTGMFGGHAICRAPIGDARQNDTIDVCCADDNPKIRDPQLLKSIDSTSNSGAFGLGYRLLDLARLGQYRGFINETEILGEITIDPTSNDTWAAEEPPAALLQAGASSMMKEEGKQSPGLSDVNDKNGHTSMSRPIALLQSRGRTTTRLAKAGHAFDSAPNLQPPRSLWESKYHKICGHGLACLREEITQEKADAFNMLALEVGRSLKEQGVLK